MTPVDVIGAGPAGSAAAISARQRGAEVRLFEKSRLPRHKVCGEFLSPEAEPLLKSLGLWDQFLTARPATIRRLALHFRSSEKHCVLPEPGFGLSRYRLDELLFQGAVQLGAQAISGSGPEALERPTVLAHGRWNPSARGGRLFGFKAHFQGPPADAIELYFDGDCYVGLNAVEGGSMNVCGLAPESLLQQHGFDIDAVVSASEKLGQRLRPLTRCMNWMTTGPLVFQNRFRGSAGELEYPAGDALSFVDPFTGSGMLSALTSGRLAGIAASEKTKPTEYLAQCRRRLETPFQFSALCRRLLANAWGERLAGLIPGQVLFRLTRPHRVI